MLSFFTVFELKDQKSLHNYISYWLLIAVSENSAGKGSFICCTASMGFKYTFIATPEHPETERGKEAKFI